MAENMEALRQAGREQLRGRGRELTREARQLHFDKNGFLVFCGECWDEEDGGSPVYQEKEGESHD